MNALKRHSRRRRPRNGDSDDSERRRRCRCHPAPIMSSQKAFSSKIFNLKFVGAKSQMPGTQNLERNFGVAE